MTTLDREVIGEVRAGDSTTTLERHEVRLSTGRVKTVPVVRRPNAVGVLVVRRGDSGGLEVLLTRQARPAVSDDQAVEIVAGKIDDDETELDPQTVAERELAEEAGLSAAVWQPLALRLWPTPGYADEQIHLYVAWDTHPVPSRPEDAHITTYWRPLHDAVKAIGTEIRDAKTVIALLLASTGHHDWDIPAADLKSV